MLVAELSGSVDLGKCKLGLLKNLSCLLRRDSQPDSVLSIRLVFAPHDKWNVCRYAGGHVNRQGIWKVEAESRFHLGFGHVSRNSVVENDRNTADYLKKQLNRLISFLSRGIYIFWKCILRLCFVSDLSKLWGRMWPFNFSAEFAWANDYSIYLILITLCVLYDLSTEIALVFSVASSYECHECFFDLVTLRKCWVS